MAEASSARETQQTGEEAGRYGRKQKQGIRSSREHKALNKTEQQTVQGKGIGVALGECARLN